LRPQFRPFSVVGGQGEKLKKLLQRAVAFAQE
jgi:hypothetical protein